MLNWSFNLHTFQYQSSKRYLSQTGILYEIGLYYNYLIFHHCQFKCYWKNWCVYCWQYATSDTKPDSATSLWTLELTSSVKYISYSGESADHENSTFDAIANESNEQG